MQGAELGKFVGETIARVRRLRYEFGDEVVSSPHDWDVEFAFASGAILLCECGSDGDSVRFSDTPWVDPFAGPLSPVNEEFVRTAGKWVKHDVSAESPFADLIDSTVFDMAPMTGTREKNYGLLVNLGGPLLVLYAIADELHVRPLY